MTVATVDCRPEKLVPLLERHFHATWTFLSQRGMTLNPPSTKESEQIRSECTNPDGSVLGVRFFDVYPPGYLISPMSKYVWETATQIVPYFSNAQAVRSHHGFHAAWPEDLQNWIGATVDHHATKCKALVKGHGDIIIGDVGWRSSKMTVLQVAATEHNEIEPLRKRYPSVTFISTSQDLSGDCIIITFPSDLRKLANWIRDENLKRLSNEF